MPKTFKTNKGIYTIPDDQIASFTKDVPDAVEVQSYQVGKDTYDIPIKDTADFTHHYPNAKPLNFDSQEVKNQFNAETQQPQTDYNKLIENTRNLQKTQADNEAGKGLSVAEGGEPDLMPARNVDFTKDIESNIGQLATQFNKKPDEVKTLLSQNPDINNANDLQNLSNVKDANPLAYNRLAPIRNVSHSILNTAGTAAFQAFNNLQDANNFQEFEQNTNAQKQIINNTFQGEDAQRHLQQLEQNKAPLINSDNPQLNEEYFSPNNPYKSQLNQNQYAALKQLQMFHPEQYKEITDELNADKNVKWVNDINYKIGIEQTKKDLEDAGIHNLQNYLNEQANDLVNAAKTATPDQFPALKQKYDEIQGKLADIPLRASKYPTLEAVALDRQVKELLQKPDVNSAGVLPYHAAKGAIGDPLESLNNIFTNLLGSNDDIAKLNITKKGEAQSPYDYTPESYRSEGSNQIFKFPKSVQDEAAQIQNDNNLTDKQKYAQTAEMLRNNADKISMVANPNAGNRADFLSKATWYHNAATVGDIAGIAVQTALLNGSNLFEASGATGKALKMANAATPMFLSTQNNFYKDAVANNEPNPLAYANTHATIMAAAGLINPDFSIAKRALGLNTVAGKVLAGVDEATWNKVLADNPSLLSKFANTAKGVLGEAGKMAAIYGAGTSVAGDVADKLLLNKNLSTDDIMNNAVKSMKDVTINSLLLYGIGGVMNFNKGEVTPMEKGRIFELGNNPDIKIQEINDLVDKNQLPREQADKQIAVIENVAKLKSLVPTENAKGKPLSPADQADYLFNLFNKEKAKGLTKSLPEAHEDKLTEVQATADALNNHIFAATTETQLESQKSKLEKQLDEKDEDGKNVLQDKDRATANGQLDAINLSLEKIKQQKNTTNIGTTKTEENGKTESENEGRQNVLAQNAAAENSTNVTVTMPKDTGKTSTKDGVTVIEPTVRPSENINVQMPAQVGHPEIIPLQNESNQTSEVQQPTKTESGTIAETGENQQPTSEATPTETTTAEPIKPTDNTTQTGEQPEGGEEKVTGVKKSITEPLRGELGLPKVQLPKMGSDIEELQKAKERVDSGKSNPVDLVDRILTDKNAYKNEDEVMDMQYYAHQLETKNNDLREQLSRAETPEDKATISGQLQQLSDAMDRQTEASQIAGNKWGNIGNKMQPVIDMGFNISREKIFIKDAYDGEVPQVVKDQINTITKERDDAITEKKAVEEKLRKALADKALDKLKKQVKGKEDLQKLKDEAADLKKELKTALKKDLGQLNSGIPIPQATLEVLGKLAVNYLKQGIVTVDGIVNKIYDDIKDDIKIPFTKKDVRDWIINASDIERDVETGKLNRKAEGLENKITPPILDKTGKPTEQQPLNKPKSEQQIFQNNTEWVKANQRVINAEYKMRQLKRKAFESQKNMFQKGLMWAGRLVRLSVLSGYNVLLKLAAAASIGGAIKRIPEQSIGLLYSHIFKGISEKAPIEGFLNADAEAKFYKEFFNPVKFAQNSAEILKSGESNLSKKFSSGAFEHVPILYLPTDLHQIIKDPVKRATFEASFKNGLVWAEKNGLDINDTLVVNSIENAAYKRAQYEVFQESNAVSRYFNNWKGQLEKGEGKIAGVPLNKNAGSAAKFAADFLIPVSTVPVNITRRLASSSPIGLIRGTAKVINAYRKGIENLSNDEAESVMRQLKQGSLGTALWLVGWYGYNSFGGLYTPYNSDKKRVQGDKLSNEMVVGGVSIPKPVQHALPLEIIQTAATARRVFDEYRQNKDANVFKSTEMAGMASIGALTEQIPIVSTPALLYNATQDPYEARKLNNEFSSRVQPQILKETGVVGNKTNDLQKLIDKNKTGETINRRNIHAYEPTGKPREITIDEYRQFKETRDSKIEKGLTDLYNNGFPQVVNGKTQLIPYDKLTTEQQNKAVTDIKNEATRATEKELLPIPKAAKKDKAINENLIKKYNREHKK